MRVLGIERRLTDLHSKSFYLLSHHAAREWNDRSRFFEVLCSPGHPGTHQVDQAGFELTEIPLPLPGIKGVNHYTQPRIVTFKKTEATVICSISYRKCDIIIHKWKDTIQWFEKFLKYTYLCACVWTCAVCVEVRRNLVGVSSQFSPCGPWERNSVITLGRKGLYTLRHLPDLGKLLKRNWEVISF